MEVPTDSLDNWQSVVQGLDSDNVYSEMLKSSDTLLAQEIKPETPAPQEETPKFEPVTEVPKDVVMTKSSLPVNLKGDQNAPLCLHADDALARFYTVVDSETDQKIENVVYANRLTSRVIVFPSPGEFDEFPGTTKDGNPVLVQLQKTIHFVYNQEAA